MVNDQMRILINPEAAADQAVDQVWPQNKLILIWNLGYLIFYK